MNLEPGIHYDVPSDVYHTDPALSASVASQVLWHGKRAGWAASPLNPKLEQRQSKAFAIGTAAHLLLLEPDQVDSWIVVISADDYRTNAAKAQRDLAIEAGKTPLLMDEWVQVADMRQALRNSLRLGALPLPFDTAPTFAEGGFSGGKAETTLVWDDPVTGIRCKARPDYLKPGNMVDFKTSAIALDDLDGYASRMGWHERAAWYLDGHTKLTGKRATYWYCVQSTVYPYLVQVAKVSAEDIERGRALNAEACRLWAECLAGNWSDGPERASVVTISQWRRYRDMDRLGEERPSQVATGGYRPAEKIKDADLRAAADWQRPL